MVRQAGFNRQNGHNQALNHAGNMVGAGLSGLLGWQFGFTAVFWLAALFGILSIAFGADDSAAMRSMTTKREGSTRAATTNAKVGGITVPPGASRC